MMIRTVYMNVCVAGTYMPSLVSQNFLAVLFPDVSVELSVFSALLLLSELSAFSSSLSVSFDCSGLASSFSSGTSRFAL